MSDDTTEVPPPSLRWFSAGIRFFDLTGSLFPYIFPLVVQAEDVPGAIKKAWDIFKDNTYDEKTGLHELLGIAIIPFHVGVVDCTELMVQLSELSTKEEEPKKPKPRQRKSKGNVVDLFPQTPPPQKPPRTPPKK